MTEQEALEITKNENLKINWFKNQPLQENEMVIDKKDTIYRVYGTDERASIRGIVKTFTTLEEALDDVIYKARL